MPAVTGSAVTPMKHTIPLQANFEEWMRLAKDNKINATNSWGLALIDYFHDMRLLKEGDGIDFQKASTTLDGCVKIYTSRVDSVADDTGRLLNGLAESGNKKRRGGDAEDEDGDGEDGEDGEESQGKKKSRRPRTAEKTLVDDFSQLQLKKVDAEMGVDPLFKKASADFDEGGAKGLLLNHLTIDSKGRIIFDSSDDIEDVQVDKKDATPAPGEAFEDEQDGEKEKEEEGQVAVEIDLSRLANQFFPDLNRLEQLDVCAPLKDYNFWDTDAPLELPFLDSASDDWRKQADAANEEAAGEETALFGGDDGGLGFDDDDGGFGDADLPEPGFGEGGEAWARDAALEPQARVNDLGLDGDEDARDSTEGAEDGAAGGDGYFSIIQGMEDAQENILSYFDNALKKNWAGPEHWRIRKIKDSSKPAPTVKRKEKEPFIIDFMAPMTQEMADLLFIKPATEKSISMAKDQRKAKTKNLLPDDKHFNSKDLAHLFLKPKVRIGQRKAKTRTLGRSLVEQDPNVNEEFFAHQQAEAAADDAPQGNYDANFFDEAPGMPDFDDEDDHFEDALDHRMPQSQDTVGGSQPLGGTGAAQGGFGDNLVTNTRRFKPMYMEFARVAKKVDAKKLKENLWNGLGLEEVRTLLLYRHFLLSAANIT